MMTKLLLTAALIFPMASETAHAQYDNKTYYGPDGRIVGKSTTSSTGLRTYFDATGAVVGRARPEPDGSVIYYDRGGNRVHVDVPNSPRR